MTKEEQVAGTMGELVESGEGKAIYAALAAARAEFGRASRDGSNPHLKNRYPTLSSIVEACDQALARHGLTYSQPVIQTSAGPALRTVLMHLETGERIESECPLLFDSSGRINPMQALGSAITYARRYGLESLLGLMRDDDDGEGAFQRKAAARVEAERGQPEPPAVRPVPDRPAADNRPAQPFGVWIRSAAERLGIPDRRLVDQLHESAVKQGNMAAVEPEVRAQALARRYYDQARGAFWRDWMRAECKNIRAELQKIQAQPQFNRA